MTRKLISTGSTFERDMAYSRAVVRGDWCFVSGITGYDYSVMRLPDGMADQASKAFDTLFSVVDEAGFQPTDLVRLQYTVTDRSMVKDLQPVLAERLGEIRPAATLVVAGLMQPEMLFEVEATAFKG